MAVGADRLGGLHQVFDLRQVGVGVTVVDQRVEELHRLPDPHLAMVLAQVLPLFRSDEVERLMAVIQPVELADGRADVRSVIAERRLLAGLRDSAPGETSSHSSRLASGFCSGASAGRSDMLGIPLQVLNPA